MELTFKLKSNQFKKILGEYILGKMNCGYEEIKSITVSPHSDGYMITVDLEDEDDDEEDDA